MDGNGSSGGKGGGGNDGNGDGSGGNGNGNAYGLPGPTDPNQVNIHLAYAEASIMLLECLMRVLVERKLIDRDELMQEVDNAIQTKQNMVAEKQHPELSAIAAGVLTKIGNSLDASS